MSFTDEQNEQNKTKQNKSLLEEKKKKANKFCVDQQKIQWLKSIKRHVNTNNCCCCWCFLSAQHWPDVRCVNWRENLLVFGFVHCFILLIDKCFSLSPKDTDEMYVERRRRRRKKTKEKKWM